jgi:hypothetical protein
METLKLEIETSSYRIYSLNYTTSTGCQAIRYVERQII